MSSSRWPRSPSHGKCSRRFCGSSRNCGRSHHQGLHETFDVMHSRAIDGMSAPKCQGKWPDQTLDQAFGLPEVLVAVSTSRLSCKRAGKARTLMPVWDSSGEARLRKLTLTKIWDGIRQADNGLVGIFGSVEECAHDKSQGEGVRESWVCPARFRLARREGLRGFSRFCDRT